MTGRNAAAGGGARWPLPLLAAVSVAPDTAYEFRVRAERTSGGTLYRFEAATAEARTPSS